LFVPLFFAFVCCTLVLRGRREGFKEEREDEDFVRFEAAWERYEKAVSVGR
jgi:hypothetical protein